jgi:hypothetical protein
MHHHSGGFGAGQNFIAQPFQLADGLQLFHYVVLSSLLLR